MSVTQKQIADHLGVSQSLVTQALRGGPGISENSRQRIQAAARELGYDARSNMAARSLRARRGGSRVRTHTLAILMGDFFDGMPLHEIPFYKPIIRGLKAEAERRDLDLSFFAGCPSRVPRLLAEGGVDGIISLYSDPFGEQFRHTPPPCPVLHVGDGEPEEWVLRPDDKQGIYLATKHLIALGHRRIAYLGDFVGSQTADVAYKNRLQGYLDGLGEGGLKVRNTLIESHIGGPESASGAAGMSRLLERTRDFTAAVCFNDTSALGAIAELRRHGLGVPGDVSVTGFDDVWDAYGSDPALTTVYFDRLEMGRRAIAALCDATENSIARSLVQPSGHELLPVGLVLRASSAPPRKAGSLPRGGKGS